MLALIRLMSLVSALCFAACAGVALAAPDCAKFAIDPDASVPVQVVAAPPGHVCTPHISNGVPLPDPVCTPGAVNPTLTADILRDPDYRTSCNRDHATTARQKARTYGWYDVQKPLHNVGQNQICELDHLVSIELGGADTLDNIWPQCGPDAVTLRERYFKQKDLVENYLAAQVKAGAIELEEAQRVIASDWTVQLPAAMAARH